MATNRDYNEIAKHHVPDNAPERPANPILERRAWAKMWLEDNNTLWSVVGDTGDGKSFASLRIGEVLDPNFSIDNVAFDIVEFIEKVVDDSYGRGSVIVLEEGSVEASSYDWHSDSNRVFAKILDTWRHQNRMGIINLPNFQALEKGARRRTKGIVKMQHAAPWRDYSQAKFYDSKYGNIEDKFTTPFPTIDGKVRKHIRFSMPSDELVEEYEQAKEEYTGNLNEELLEQLLADQEEQEAKDRGPQEIAQEIVDEGRAEDYVETANNGQTYIKQEYIEMDYDVGGRKGKKAKAALERMIDKEKVTA
jgi:hypothetical protein